RDPHPRHALHPSPSAWRHRERLRVPAHPSRRLPESAGVAMKLAEAMAPGPAAQERRIPRLGFLGLGWIGRQRMQVLATSGAAEIAALTDPAPERLDLAQDDVPGAIRLRSLEALLEA